MKTLALASATIALAFTASPALANTYETQTMTVETADLNLATPEGQARLDRRIESAARDVCGANVALSGTRIPSPKIGDCVAAARASAKKQVAALVEDQRRGG